MEPLLFRNGNEVKDTYVSGPLCVSVEPLLFRNGNLETLGLGRVKLTRFSGATSFQKWKFTGPFNGSYPREIVSVEPLLFRNGNDITRTSRHPAGLFQWSHFFSEMEMAAIFRPLQISKKSRFARGLLT